MPLIPLHQLEHAVIRTTAVTASGSAMFSGVFGVTVDQTILELGDRTYGLIHGGGATGADVDTDVAAAGNWAGVVTALAAAVNGDAGQGEVEAVDLGSDSMGLYALIEGVAGNAFALVATADPGVHVDVTGAGTLLGGEAEAVHPITMITKAITAAEVLGLAAGNAVGIGSVDLDAVPVVMSVMVEDAAGDWILPTGVGVDLVVIAGTQYAVALRDAAAALAATDVVRVVLQA